MKQNPEKILVCRTDALGDALLTLPVCAALKENVPGVIVDMLASTYTQPILSGQPGVDHVVVYDKIGKHRSRVGFRTWVADLRKRHYDAALVVFPDRRVSWALYQAQIPVRVGTARRWWSLLYNRKVRHSRAQAVRHEADYNLDLVRALGINVELKAPRLVVTPEERQWARGYLKQAGIQQNDRLVVMHPGGHGSSVNWLPDQYGRLAELLIQKLQCKILLTGSIKEQPVLDSVQAACPSKLTLLTQAVSLPQLAALIEQAGAFVSGNTGPMHVAAGLGVPVAAVFPASGVTGPVRWRPLTDKAAVLTPPEHAAWDDLSAVSIKDAVQAVAGFFK